MRKPRVAVIHPGIGESLGGSQVFVLELCSRLKDKCDITILSTGNVNDLCKPITSLSRGSVDYNSKFLLGIARKIIKQFASTPDIVIEHLSSFFPVLFHLLNNRYDVIYPNNDWGGLIVSSIVRKIKGTPVLFTEHNGLIERGKIAARNLNFKPDRYVVLSNEHKIWTRKYFPQINAEYIPNGVDFNRFNPEIEPAYIDLPRPIYLAASRNQSNKRLDLVIEAVARLNKGSLLILSSGNNIDAINQKGRAILGDDRFKLMTVPYELMASYYRACDVFTLSSIYEPFGLVFLEAMACNKPVVTRTDFSRMDIVGEAGILCNVEDPDIYSAALERAANSDFDDIPYHQARKYSWDLTANKYSELIYSMVYGNIAQLNKSEELQKI